MPVYEYKCNKCEHCFSEMFKVDDRKIPCESPCPECGEQAVEQQLSAAAICDPGRIGRLKPQGDFREVMQKIKRSHRHNRNIKIKDY